MRNESQADVSGSGFQLVHMGGLRGQRRTRQTDKGNVEGKDNEEWNRIARRNCCAEMRHSNCCAVVSGERLLYWFGVVVQESISHSRNCGAMGRRPASAIVSLIIFAAVSRSRNFFAK